MAPINRRYKPGRTAAGILGSERSSMYSDYLLMREGLGEPATFCHHVDQGRSMGLPPISKDIGVRECLTWRSGGRGAYGVSEVGPRDFVALTRAALDEGLTTAPEHGVFRKTHDIRRPVAHNTFEAFEQRHNANSRAHTLVHGVGGRPSTPIQDVIAHRYQTDWIEALSARLSTQRSQTLVNFGARSKLLDTRGSVLRPALVVEPLAVRGGQAEAGEQPEGESAVGIDRALDTFRGDDRLRALKSSRSAKV
jgi:hypothetical protein